MLIFVLEAVDDQMVPARSMIGLVIVLYVVTIVSFCLPQVEYSSLRLIPISLGSLIYLFSNSFEALVFAYRKEISVDYC